MDLRSIGRSRLKSLSHHSSGPCDEVGSRILTGTPVLEYLKLEESWGLTNIKVHSRSLRELIIHGYEDYSEINFPLRISARHLLLLRIKGHLGVKRLKIIEALSLVEAELDFKMVIDQGGLCGVYCETFEEMLRKIWNATKIIVAGQCLQAILTYTLTLRSLFYTESCHEKNSIANVTNRIWCIMHWSVWMLTGEGQWRAAIGS